MSVFTKPERYQPTVLGPKDWGTELLVVELPFAIGKVMTMRAGASGPLQYHEKKHEAFYLYSGLARVTMRDDDGALKAVEMQSGETYLIPPGTVHQVTAIDECVMFEVSNPVFDDRVPYVP
jgi:oxalate decarboxylase/phosphoglucose isomerase-like protein (cupin superfamily)